MSNSHKNNKKAFKALLLDVDGTLIPNKEHGLPSQKVIKAINQIKDSIFVGIATGRRLALVSPIFDRIQFSAPAILIGGSQIYDITSKKYLWMQALNSDDVYSIWALLTKYHVQFYLDEENTRTKFYRGYKFQEVFNILVDGLKQEDVDTLMKELSIIPNVSAYTSPSWTESELVLYITHTAATKQHAVTEVAKILPDLFI